jgi:superfamily II DNA or RNA helicase
MSKKKEEVQEEALEILQDYNRATVAVSMGVGKTLIGLKHIERSYRPGRMFLVVAPKLAILKSWEDEAKKFNLEHLLPHIHFTTYLSLNKQSLNYHTVYADECHNLLYSHQDWLDKYTGKIIGLTGTPPKIKNSEKGKMISKFCPVVYEYITDNAVEDGILNDYSIVVHLLPLDPRRNMSKKTKTGKTFMSSELSDYNYWSERLLNCNPGVGEHMLRVMRMKAMMSYPSKEQYAKNLFNSISDKCILFANTQVQADRMCTHSYHSKNPDSETNLQDFKDGNINKLSCVLQLNEGVNIPDLKQGIIMHAYGNERKSTQRIGRLLRLNPKEKAIVHVLCYEDTVDYTWVTTALDGFDESKIKYVKKV